MHVRLIHLCSLADNTEIRLKTSQLRPVFFFGSGRDMTHKLFCPPVQIFSGSEGTVFAGGSQRSWWQMYWMMGWTQSKWHAFIPEGRKSAMKAIYVSGKCLIFVCFSCSYVAMFPYTPRKEDELELRKGEMFLVLERCQDGWFKGTSMHTGKIGVFPGNYMSPVSRSGYSYQHTVYTHTGALAFTSFCLWCKAIA